jgi:hypothetical protein
LKSALFLREKGGIFMASHNVTLPAEYDPYDMRLKLQFNPKADALNVIAVSRKNPTLCCGAMKGGKPCKQPAGAGTSHAGYGRCKLHGGCSTGPKTPEGKAKSVANNIIHGLYASTLLPEEQEIFNQFTEDEAGSLVYEISFLRAKIISYLARNSKKLEADTLQYGEEKAYAMSKVYYSESENGARSYYHAGTIEDRALDRALARLRHLVETHNRLKGDDEDGDIMDTINAELRAASKGSVFISWGGEAQSKAEVW